MKVGSIVVTNKKGQVVIPKEVREALGISPNRPLNLILQGRGIFLYPVTEVLTKGEEESSYVEILKRTQGTWASEDLESLRATRKKLELTASRKRKEQW